MKRAVSLSLKFATESKRNKVSTLVNHYRHAVDFYLKSLSDKSGSLDKETLARLQDTRLSERYKSNALKQALGIMQGRRKKRKKTPEFNGFPCLDAKFVKIEEGKGSFDLVLKLSALEKGRRICIPLKKTAPLNKWLARGTLVQGCELRKDRVVLWVKVEDQDPKEGRNVGVDIGMRRLITTSEGDFHGKYIGRMLDKIDRKKKNSKAYRRALKERDNYVNRAVNSLDWDHMGTLCYEDLTGITTGRRGLRKFRRFRKRQQHWTVRQVVSRILMKCQENRVRPVPVCPRNTSRSCPACGGVAEANRNLDDFRCVFCGHCGDSDIVGATNILARGSGKLGSVESPNKKSHRQQCLG